ncbi:UNVERIFIED_CONTAM: glycerate kinase [Prevotella sp. 15_C9]
MKIILAFDSFKGCLSSMKAASIAETAIRSLPYPIDVVKIPVTDGGDGMLSVYNALFNCKSVAAECHDALMRPIKTTFLVREDGVCVIETAAACGINLLKKEELNPLRATTYGVGELMIAAIKQGCKEFIIGLGGSATSDCGLGMLLALKEEYGEDWFQHQQLSALKIRLASDVNIPLYGSMGAANVFGPQKGATDKDIVLLNRRAKTFATMSARKIGRDYAQQPGAGAAGGLGYAFLQFFNATMISGADLLLSEVQFEKKISDADFIITGEGSADKQTLMGKIPFKLLQYGQNANIPVHLLAGRIADKEQLLSAGFASARFITPPNTPLEKAVQPACAKKNLTEEVTRLVNYLYNDK